MTGKTHQIIGISTGLATLLFAHTPIYQPATLAWVLVLSSLGSLLPDIDQPGSTFWRRLPLGNFGGELVNPFLAHRNLTHSLLGYAVVCYGVHSLLNLCPGYWGLNPGAIFIAFATAYGSHILADMVTVQGVPLLFPIGRMFGLPPRPFQGIRIETGGWFENLMIFPIVNLLLVVLLITHQEHLRIILFLPHS